MNISVYISLLSLLIMTMSCGSKTKDDNSGISYMESDIYVQPFQAEVGDIVSLKICETAPLDKIKAMFFNGFAAQKQILFQTEEFDCLTVEIDSTNTRVAGAYTVDALIGDQFMTIATVTLDPRKATGKIESFVGPKTVNYGDESGSMMTAFPVDEFHNATAAQDSVKYVSFTGSAIDSQRIVNKGTYSSIHINDLKVSKLLIGATIDKANTIEQSVRFLSGCPDNIKIDLSEVFPVADGRQFFKASTQVMKDADGTIIKDGTMVYFIISAADGQVISKFRAVAINGIASTWIKNPVYEGYYDLKVHVCNNYSEAHHLYFTDLIKEFNYEWKKEKNIVKIGPVTSALDQFIPDGTPVVASFNDGTQTQELQAVLYDGCAVLDLDRLWMDTVPEHANITIYGRVYKIMADKP